MHVVEGPPQAHVRVRPAPECASCILFLCAVACLAACESTAVGGRLAYLDRGSSQISAGTRDYTVMFTAPLICIYRHSAAAREQRRRQGCQRLPSSGRLPGLHWRPRRNHHPGGADEKPVPGRRGRRVDRHSRVRIRAKARGKHESMMGRVNACTVRKCV